MRTLPVNTRRCRYSMYAAAAQQGFSLIEFLVASAISIIVLIAAGSTYFMTRQLNQVAGERLNVQQDLRNAATLMIRDARQAGTFGCANLAETNSNAAQVHVTTPYTTTHPLGLRNAVTDNYPDGFGLRLMSGSQFIASNAANISNFIPEGNALIFVYGDGYASVNNLIPNAPTASSPVVNVTGLDVVTDTTGAIAQALAASGTAPIVISSCNQVQVLRRGTEYTVSGNQITPTTPITVANAHAASGAFLTGQLNVSKLTGSAYLVGRPTGATRNGLYRFHLAANGTWAGPQLLVSDMVSANGMDIQLGYVKTNTCTTGASNPAETFTFHNMTTDIPDHSKLPALIRIILKVESGTNRVPGVDIGAVSDYVIDAAIRNGNVCANRGMGL